MSPMRSRTGRAPQALQGHQSISSLLQRSRSRAACRWSVNAGPFALAEIVEKIQSIDMNIRAIAVSVKEQLRSADGRSAGSNGDRKSMERQQKRGDWSRQNKQPNHARPGLNEPMAFVRGCIQPVQSRPRLRHHAEVLQTSLRPEKAPLRSIASVACPCAQAHGKCRRRFQRPRGRREPHRSWSEF